MLVERVNIKQEGRGIEAAARKARYQVFSRYLADGGVLLLGHHLNDQAETMLMRFIKGLGPQALRGMPQRRVLAQGMIFRPWLNLPRVVLEQAMHAKSYSWVEDESNLDRRFERNFVRHEILPLLESRRPSVLQDLQHAAQRSAEYVEFTRQWCQQNQDVFLSQVYAKERALDLQQLKTFSLLQQRFIVRYWFDWLGVEQPNENNFQRLLDDLVQAQVSKKAEVVWKNYCVRIYDGALFCLPASDIENSDVEQRDYAEHLALSEIIACEEGVFSLSLPAGILKISRETEDQGVIEQINQQAQTAPFRHYVYSLRCCLPVQTKTLLIRSRQEGDKLELNSDYAQTLKKIYQSHRVLPWHRRHVPIIALVHDSGLPADTVQQTKVVASLAGYVAHPYRIQHQFESDNASDLVLRFTYETDSGLLI